MVTDQLRAVFAAAAFFLAGTVTVLSAAALAGRAKAPQSCLPPSSSEPTISTSAFIQRAVPFTPDMIQALARSLRPADDPDAVAAQGPRP